MQVAPSHFCIACPKVMCLLHHRTWGVASVCKSRSRPKPKPAGFSKSSTRSSVANLKKQQQQNKISMGLLCQQRPESLLEELPQGALHRQINHSTLHLQPNLPPGFPGPASVHFNSSWAGINEKRIWPLLSIAFFIYKVFYGH